MFLASDRASYISGVTIGMDGGRVSDGGVRGARTGWAGKPGRRSGSQSSREGRARSEPEQLEDELRVLVGDRQRLNAELFLRLQRLQSRGGLTHVRVDEAADRRLVVVVIAELSVAALVMRVWVAPMVAE